MNYLGIDIGGTSVKCGLISPEGQVLLSRAYPADVPHYNTNLMETALEGTKSFVSELASGETDPVKAVKKLEIQGIGIDTTGLPDEEGTVRGSVEHIPHYMNAPVGQVFRECFGLPVRVINDANAAALAELWSGSAKSCEQAVVLTIGTGIGAGIIVNGRLLSGAHGFAGEVGHSVIKKDGPMTPCGNPGTFEEYAAVTGLLKLTKSRLAEEGRPLPEEGLNGRVIFRLAEEGDKFYSEILKTWIRDMAVGIVNLVYTFDPEIVVIGGAVSAQDALLIRPLREEVRAQLMPLYARVFRLEPATHGNEAGMIGAVYALRNP